MRRWFVGVWFGSALGAVSGCAVLWGLTHSPQVAPCPGDEPALKNLVPGIVIRDQVRVRSADVDFGFDLIMETSEEGLLLVGLSSLGTKAFVIRQRGQEVEAENYLGPGLPFPPRNVLRDVRRVHFREAADGSSVVEAQVGNDRTVEPEGCGYRARFVTVMAQIPGA